MGGDAPRRDHALDRRVEAVRHFNRDYTRRIGVLREGLLDSPFSLTQARVLYELAHREQPTATALGQELGLDAGYLSRILSAFARRGLLARRPSKTDGRQSLLRLTPRGRQVFAKLDAGSAQEVLGLIAPLSGADQERLVSAMRTIEGVLGERDGGARARPTCRIRAPRPGDMGWVIHRHGEVYDREWGWGQGFEALVAEIVVKFMAHHDPKRERAWIAELDGERVGSIFLVAKSKTVAKLRLLLVEPAARGCGVGQRLVEECIHFARRAGIARSCSDAVDPDPARHIYAKAGFALVGRSRTTVGKACLETWAGSSR
jgi:DNA-binding MarR family transcriptional regulator/GNAT superfamily N-acetyltransferase